LRLPVGTVYCAASRPWDFGGLHIKGRTLPPNDFVSLQLEWVAARDSGEACDRLAAMLNCGKSYPMNEDYGRDGGFDDREVYLVWEPADLTRMIGYFQAALGAVLSPAAQLHHLGQLEADVVRESGERLMAAAREYAERKGLPIPKTRDEALALAEEIGRE
jgi:hypothetical protein